MEKEKLALVAQLLTAMQDAARRLEKFYINRDMEGLNDAKSEILSLQTKIDRLI